MRGLGVPGSAATFAPALVICYGITVVVHIGSVSLSTLLPFHMVDLGGSRTQVGLLFLSGVVARDRGRPAARLRALAEARRRAALLVSAPVPGRP